MIALKSRISIGFDAEAFWTALVSGGVMAVMVLSAQAHYYSKYLLPVYVVLGGLVYFSMLLLLRAIKGQDIQLLDEYPGSCFRFIVRPLEKLVTNPIRASPSPQRARCSNATKSGSRARPYLTQGIRSPEGAGGYEPDRGTKRFKGERGRSSEVWLKVPAEQFSTTSIQDSRMHIQRLDN